MAFSIQDLVNNTDFYNYFLPFLLVFTLVFAILQKIKLLGGGEEIKKYNAIVAAITGFLVVRNQNIIELLHRFLPNISFFIVVILMAIVVVGLFLPNEYRGIAGGLLSFMILVSIGLVFWALGAEQLGFEGVPYWLEDWYHSMNTGGWLLVGGILFVIFVGFSKSGNNMVKDMYYSLGRGLTEPPENK